METGLNFKNKSILATAAVFVLTCIAGYNFIYNANIDKARTLTAKIGEAKKIKIFLEEIDKLQSNIDSYSSMKNDTPDPSTFLSKIVDIANACGIKVETIKSGNVTADGQYKFLSCAIAFEAPYKKLMSFLNKLDTDKRYIRIDNINVAAVRAAGNIKPDGSQSFDGMLKKDKANGVWVKVDMDLTGFYFQ